MSASASDQAIEQLRQAIIRQGVRPDVHREIMARHRREWPTLWRAIDNLLAQK